MDYLLEYFDDKKKTEFIEIWIEHLNDLILFNNIILSNYIKG